MRLCQCVSAHHDAYMQQHFGFNAVNNTVKIGAHRLSMLDERFVPPLVEVAKLPSASRPRHLLKLIRIQNELNWSICHEVPLRYLAAAHVCSHRPTVLRSRPSSCASSTIDMFASE